MTREELQAVVRAVRAAHPGAQVELRRGLQNDHGLYAYGHFCVEYSIRVTDRAFIDPDHADAEGTQDFLERLLAELMEETSRRNREDVRFERRMARERALSAESPPVTHAQAVPVMPSVGASSAPVGARRSLWERLEA